MIINTTARARAKAMSTRMRRGAAGVALAVVAAAGLAMISTASAAAATEAVVTSVDQRGDVRLFSRPRLTRAEKKSIDIRRVTVERIDSRKARIIIKIRDVMGTPKFDQMFFVKLTEHPDTVDGPWVTDAGFTTKGRYGYTGYYAADYSDGDNCGLRSSVNATTNEVVATIPWACTAEGRVKVSVWAMTGTFRSDAPIFSRDRHNIRGYRTIIDVS
jgi:hypothetical protein